MYIVTQNKMATMLKVLVVYMYSTKKGFLLILFHHNENIGYEVLLLPVLFTS